MTKCAVCGMSIEEMDAPAKTTREGVAYYFCSETCEKTFQREREKYIVKPEKVGA